jgi:DNA-binding MarR family transcriptional regulator/GNAT superfamily N-acetyltransferase
LAPEKTIADPVEAIRRFNRFYTRQLGLLDDGLLHSEFSLSEARVLFELAHREGWTASELAQELGVDNGYLSRMLKRLVSRGIVARTRLPSDARQSELRLTKSGRAAFAPLNRAARDQVSAMIAPLQSDQAAELVACMVAMQSLLTRERSSAEPYLLRPLQVGDIGWITHRQGVLYAQEYGWDGTYEALVAGILASFVKSFDPRHEAAWVAERDGRIVGSVFVVRESASVAKLRLLYVEPSARGLGIGRRLVDECIRFARAKGYRTLSLWTNDVLTSARKIYQGAGFQKVKEERHHSFGKELIGQTWNLKLTST